MKKKKDTNMMEDTMLIGGTGIGLGVLGGVTAGVGGNTAGITAMADFMPAVGMAAGGKAVIKKVKKLKV